MTRWKAVKADFIDGIGRERAEKVKRDVDAFENGEMVCLEDVLRNTVFLREDLHGLKFLNIDRKLYETFLAYCILKICLKSVIR